jgi:hypothetical protein
LQIAGDAHITHGDQARLTDRNFAPNDLADFTLEKLAHPLVSEGLHGLR